MKRLVGKKDFGGLGGVFFACSYSDTMRWISRLSVEWCLSGLVDCGWMQETVHPLTASRKDGAALSCSSLIKGAIIRVYVQ